MNARFVLDETSAGAAPAPCRPGEDRRDVPRRRPPEDRYGRRAPDRAWRGFPSTARTWNHAKLPVLSLDELHGVHALASLSDLSGHGWSRIADSTSDAERCGRFARNARLRRTCADELRELLRQAGAEIASGTAYFVPSGGAAAQAACPQDRPAPVDALKELEEHEKTLQRMYEELLINASPRLHALLATQWQDCREIHDGLSREAQARLFGRKQLPD